MAREKEVLHISQFCIHVCTAMAGYIQHIYICWIQYCNQITDMLAAVTNSNSSSSSSRVAAPTWKDSMSSLQEVDPSQQGHHQTWLDVPALHVSSHSQNLTPNMSRAALQLVLSTHRSSLFPGIFIELNDDSTLNNEMEQSIQMPCVGSCVISNC